MSTTLQWVANPMKQQNSVYKETALMNVEISEEVKNFHQSFSEYHVTPLWDLKTLAHHIGVGKVFIKDESHRFGLNAFKVLGASYAIGKVLAKRLNCPIAELPFTVLKSSQVRQQLENITFAATTDGNHGRGVAWAAKQLGFDAVIYMPNGTTQNRLQHILNTGAQAFITKENYDDTVRWAAEQAKQKGWEIIQDTAWEGYKEVPRWIMQGYSTMAVEVLEQLADTKPTHIFLQAGVGAFAAIIASVFLDAFSDAPPKIVIVEADCANCFYRSIKTGNKTSVTGNFNTIMAGLACGEPNPIAWEMLQKDADVLISSPDWVSARGMRILANPLKEDPKVISGESGAVTTGILSIIGEPQYKELKEMLQLNRNSVVVLFSTEGDTDPQVYRNVVWDGRYPSEL